MEGEDWRCGTATPLGRIVQSTFSLLSSKFMPLAIHPGDVRAAAVRIRPLARRTPVMTSAGFDAQAGVRVFFK